MPVGQAFQISIANTVFNSINVFLASSAGASLASELLLSDASVMQEFSRSHILEAAVAIYIFGILIETISELQRKSFKSKAENKGNPYSGGLFSLARHINYGGYALWRGANAMAAGGFTAAIPTLAFFVYNFISSSIPSLDKYCTERYGDSWKEIKTKVKWQLLPGIY